MPPFGLLIAALLMAFSGVSARAGVEDCGALEQTDFSGVTDAPAHINRAEVVSDSSALLARLVGILPEEAMKEARKGVAGAPAYCRVSGYVIPSVGFELLMPMTGWNGKFLHLGCGGWCGTTAFVGLACAKHPGYACIGSDMGHTGTGGLWFRNNLQGQIDFSYRATHVATLAGKAIVQRYYAASPTHSYFVGCSTGGYQGLVEAQKFPWDFDGIVAGAPDMDESDSAVRSVWIKQNFMRTDGTPVLSADDLGLLHKAALARCDMDDGLKDGIISDPMHCQFDPMELVCKGPKRKDCLTETQVQAVRNIYGAPHNSKGIPISSRGVFPGSEESWNEKFTNTWGDEYFRDTGILSVPGKEWKYTDFDFDRDYQRSGVGVLFADTNPDLHRFKAAGGKLISYQGGTDATQIPWAIFDYYDMVQRAMGGRNRTQDFFRLFAIPGMNHCMGGEGAFAFDYLHYLEAWVEHGQAPDFMVGSHIKDFPEYGSFGLKMPLDPSTAVSFTRPVYPYPLYPKYKGSGDPKKAENFRPVQPKVAREAAELQ